MFDRFCLLQDRFWHKMATKFLVTCGLSSVRREVCDACTTTGNQCKYQASSNLREEPLRQRTLVSAASWCWRMQCATFCTRRATLSPSAAVLPTAADVRRQHLGGLPFCSSCSPSVFRRGFVFWTLQKHEKLPQEAQSNTDKTQRGNPACTTAFCCSKSTNKINSKS